MNYQTCLDYFQLLSSLIPNNSNHSMPFHLHMETHCSENNIPLSTTIARNNQKKLCTFRLDTCKKVKVPINSFQAPQ